MQTKVKLVVLLLGSLMFSSVYSVEPNVETPPEDSISKILADSAKRSLLGDNDQFPIKIEGGMEIANISSNSNYVVFEYNVPTDSQSMPVGDIVTKIGAGLNKQFCDKQDVVNLLHTHDIHFLFRFKYTDDRNVPATLTIDEICE